MHSGSNFHLTLFESKMWTPLFIFLLHVALGSTLSPFLQDAKELKPFSARTIETFPDNSLGYRLPETILPSHYDLYLEPDFDNANYSGSVQIEFTVLEGTNVIVIHRRQITVDEGRITLACNSNTSYNVLSANGSETDDHWFYNIQLSANLTVSDICVLNIAYFASDFNRDANNGFYMGTYLNENGSSEAFALTDFAPTNARRAFPCFDEPALKATFTVSIRRPADYFSISNTPLLSSTLQTDGTYLDVFNRTAKMSTYLVAWVVSKFEYTETLDRHRILGRASEIRAGRANYALNIANRTLRTLEAYTNISYTQNKVDHLAVPAGFFANRARENWGLFTYGEDFLFFYGNRTTDTSMQGLNTISSNQFSHQWFGNLVTPLWWNYIWLNEGFASYFEYYFVSLLEPEWEMMEQFIVRITQSSMSSDSVASVRHMNQDAQTPTDIAALFDGIANGKSAAVISMLEAIVSSSVFRRGLNIYLNNRKFDTATPSDLYAGLQAAVNETGYIIADNLGVAEIMETWSENPGYPVLRVERNYLDGSVTFSQSRFLLTNSTEITNRLWYIPINTATSRNHNFNDTTFEFFLTQQSATRNLSLAATDWLLINKGERGYYRVNYDETNWMLLANLLSSENYNQISKTSRAQLINDAFNLARSGRLNYTIPLNLLELFKRDTDYISFYAFFGALEHVDLILAGTNVYDTFKAYVRTLLVGGYNKTGVAETPTEAYTTQFQRYSSVIWSCKYDVPNCRNDGLNLIRQWQATDVNPFIASTEQAVSCGAMRGASESEWDFLFQKYISSNDSSQRINLLDGLTCSDNSTIIRKYLSYAISNTSGIPSSETPFILNSIYTKGLLSLETELEFIDENMDEVSRVTDVATILSGMGNYLTESHHLTRFQNLQTKHSSHASAFTTAIDTIRANIEWCNLHRGDIVSWVSSLDTDPLSSAVGSGFSTIFSKMTLFVLILTIVIIIH